jgi:hypothetical protein
MGGEWKPILSQAGLRNETTNKYNGKGFYYESFVPVMFFFIPVRI